jgi:hypothetical protein
MIPGDVIAPKVHMGLFRAPIFLFTNSPELSND